MSSEERDKLKVILSHWVKHNRGHSREFNEWAVKAKAMVEAEASEEILQAASAMDESSDCLIRALKRLEED